MSAVRMRALCALALAAVVLGGCGRRAAAPPSPPGEAESDAGFLRPPTLSAAIWSADGHVRLEGRAPPNARVRVVSPTGSALEAAAGPAGAWAVELPYDTQARLFALSAQVDGRVVRAEGALAVAPPPAAIALIARSGAPSWPTPPPSPPSQARLVSADFDNEGGFGVSGYARAGARVRLILDTRLAGQGQADASGRFTVLGLAAPAALRRHRLTLDAGSGPPDTRDVDFSAAPFLPAPFRAEREGDAWRIDWRAPAGVIQSMLVFDPKAAAA